ncbi:hypothetical protein C8J57DRAFT_1054321 [Mycena rebaudengoi]|nr:hypothetical protein C8J57DRAFT_1054321 [Mycena rebaudengoi]
MTDCWGEGAHSGAAYDDFLEGVGMGAIGLYRISKTLFVCEGWDSTAGNTTGRWYHMQQLDLALDVFICMCPSRPGCFHEKFMQEEGTSAFPEGTIEYAEDNMCQTILFYRELSSDAIDTTYLFSVATLHKPDLLKGRAIVTHRGDGKGSESWTCSREASHVFQCIHISAARKRLAEITGSSGELDKDTQPDGKYPVPIRQAATGVSVSFLSILPPVWAGLPEDAPLYQRKRFEMPEVIYLGKEARCSCGAPPSLENGEKIFLECTVYHLSEAVHSQIEVQMCNKCSKGRRRFIGPDGRQLGIFNYNNRTLFTHALFDEYTSAFTSSETPFVSWVTLILRRYATAGGSIPFVTERVFRTAWFLYAELQDLQGDMTCPECGPCPDDTIWDGVTLAFNRKQLLASLCPPTTVFDDAPEHMSTYIYQQCLLVDKDVRRAVKQIVTGPAAAMTVSTGSEASGEMGVSEGVDEEIERTLMAAKRAKATLELVKVVEDIPIVVNWLNNVDRALGGLFQKNFGIVTIGARVRPPAKCYLDLLAQVAAEESVLQMIPVPALVHLMHFCDEPTDENRAELLCVPAIYSALKHEKITRGDYSEELLGTCRWMRDRAIEVVARLMRPEAQLEGAEKVVEDPWRESGSYYSMPQIRLRPRYPRLKHDQIHEGSKRGATCSKFYAQYGQQRLTGGIMCVWCTHSICYGFHCIPLGEGRNDVFSAIVTHWPQAPKRVIYDFACALGPYCLTREPDFFAETQFMIDDFHASGHSKCSPAAFLKTYALVDPRLGRINSSAAECGNGGIARIRKSVSYMTQARAIIFTQVFIAIWNRMRIRKQRGIQ